MNSNCKNNCCKNKSNSSYITWVLEVLGPVILGSKPSEILNISTKDGLRDNKIEEIENFFSNCMKISYKIINTYDGGTRILFINEESLANLLSNKKCINFLKFIGYPTEYNLDDYTNVLIEKLHSSEFPHEIGIFLGYPLKDVVGFMGYGNYKFYKTKNWRVYGDPSISEKVYNKFVSDRNRMKELLKLNSLDNLLNVI
ncbi:MAG: DUF3793 family protein [Peptostreptococcaceae bacterium]